MGVASHTLSFIVAWRTETMRLIPLGLACLLTCGALANSAKATVVSFISSATFDAAIAGSSVIVEQYATGTNGQIVANGGTFDGLTYSFTTGPLGTLTGGIITNEFNSFSGLSAAGNQSTGQRFFFDGDQVSVTFPAPIRAVGVFFNVNLESGNYDHSFRQLPGLGCAVQTNGGG